MQQFTAYGDSITLGSGASPASNAWMALLTPINKGTSNFQAADVAKIIGGNGGGVEVNPVAGSEYSVMIGTNDHRQYKTDATKQDYFKKYLTSALVSLSTINKVRARDISVAYTGSWTNTSDTPNGKFATAVGAKATATVYGTSIYVGFIIHSSGSATGIADVKIDGVTVGTISCKGFTPSMVTVTGLGYSTGCARFSGLSAGAHTVEVVVTNAGWLMLEYITGNYQPSFPKVVVSNIIKMTASGYTTYGTSQANVDTFNTIIAGVVADLQADGLNIVTVDNYTSVDPSTDISADGVHPNNAGHLKIKNNFGAVL